MTLVRWTGWDGEGLEEARFAVDAGGATVTGDLRAGPQDAPWARYRLAADARWRTRECDVDLTDGRSLRLRSDGQGSWTVGGQPAPGLDGALDVDLSGTPSTNTLAIRRLGLAVGVGQEIVVAYVDLPGLGVRVERQSYVRLAGHRYRFAQPGTGFVRDIDVDGEGIVSSYPGLFRRLP